MKKKETDQAVSEIRWSPREKWKS